MARKGDETKGKEEKEMTLTAHVKRIARDMGLSFIHGTTEQLGVLVDTVKPPLVALVDYDTSTQDFHGCQRVEAAPLSIFFLERASPSLSPDEVVALYERCKKRADAFIDKAGGVNDSRYSTLGISGTVTFHRVNLRYKGIYGGVMVSVKVTDFHGSVFGFNWKGRKDDGD